MKAQRSSITLLNAEIRGLNTKESIVQSPTIYHVPIAASPVNCHTSTPRVECQTPVGRLNQSTKNNRKADIKLPPYNDNLATEMNMRHQLSGSQVDVRNAKKES